MKTFDKFKHDMNEGKLKTALKLVGLTGAAVGYPKLLDKIFGNPRKKLDKGSEKFLKTGEFQEGVATLAIPAGVGVLKKIATSSALKAASAGALTGAGYLAAKKASEGPFSGTGGFDASKSRTKRQYLGLPPSSLGKSSDLTKQQKKDRKIEGQKEIIDRRDDKIAKEGPGDLVPGAKRARLKKLLKDFKDRFQKNLQDKKLINKQIDDRTKAIDDFKKTSKQKRSEKKTRKVENKRSELANKREWENLKSQGIVSGNYDPNYFK